MILGILQARTSSRRLPGKVLQPILGEPMLARQIERLRRCGHIDELVVATSDDPSDAPLAELAGALGISAFRGSLQDVLDRFHALAASRPAADTLVRLTGDCPLADPQLIDAVIAQHVAQGNDYTTNALDGGYPDGLDVEVIARDALDSAWREARLPSQREHVTLFIYQQAGRYRIGRARSARDLSRHRWVVDEPRDLQFVREVYAALYPADPAFTTADILQLLASRPELCRMNDDIPRDAGLARSLAEDAEFLRSQS